MSVQIFLVSVVAALVTVLVYLAVGRMSTGHWGKGEVAASEDFTLDSANVLIGLLFSIVLAFVVGSVLVDYDHARSEAQQEANAIGAIYGYAWGIPEPAQSTWKRGARYYATLVIDQDWPLMNRKQASETAWTALTSLRDDIFAFTAANDREQSFQDRAIDKIQEIYDARRTRVDLVNAGIPDFLWYTLIGGAALVVLFPLLSRPHLTGRILIAVGIQGAVIAGALYLVSVLNHPYSGTYRVEPSAFQILVNRLTPPP
ncbi:MAG: hypothetical protein ACRDSR_03630 [Pseudonocardiaceae bacterium]